MALQYFGTDGIRGPAYQAPLRLTDVARWGAAWAAVARAHAIDTLLIGWDPRESSVPIARALASGAGDSVRVVRLGMRPTPAVALAAATAERSWGVVISASHNPPHDNGIKGFNACGEKLEQDIEEEIERTFDALAGPLLFSHFTLGDSLRPSPEVPLGTYVSSLGNVELPRDISVVVDCAHGATGIVAPRVFHGPGVRFIGVPPDGRRINVGVGATDLSAVTKQVITTGADLGIAFDGDGDRCLLVMPNGTVVDGDQILWLLASSRYRSGDAPPGVVGTVMSNGGLEASLGALNIPFVRAPVGDKFLSRELRVRGWDLAAEPSGHLIQRRVGPTGDGIATALAALRELKNLSPATRWDWRFDPWPSAAKSLHFSARAPIDACPHIDDSIRRVEETFGDSVRLVVRWSGTEPKLRLLVEGRDANVVGRVLQDLESAATADLGASSLVGTRAVANAR